MESTANSVPLFSVTVQPSGRTFEVAADESLLTAGIRQGINLPYGCKDGACGSCKCKKLEGSVNHGPHQEKALSNEEAAAGFILTCCARPQSNLVLESRQVTEVGALPIKKMPARVANINRISDDIMVLRMQLPANDTFVYRPGQFVEFILRDGSRRSYSMASAPHNESGLEFHIRHLPGGKFTDYAFTQLKEKEILRLEGPLGSFGLREESPKPIVLLASGTGFAPIKAILEHMRHIGSSRPTSLYWGGRRPGDFYLDSWVRSQMALMPNLSYVPVVSGANPADQWNGRQGLVHQAVLQDFSDLSGHQVYACGVPAMVEAARHDFSNLAMLPLDEFYADAFTSEADKH